MSKSNTKIPFKSSKNKNSPLNMNEIDINLLMQNPKHIHKMMGKNVEDDCGDDSSNNFQNIKGFKQRSSDNVDEMSSQILKKYMNKYVNKYKSDAKYDTVSLKKDTRNKLGKGLDDFRDTVHDHIEGYANKTYDKVGSAFNEFKKDTKEQGFERTVNNRKDLIEDLISDFLKNNDTLDNFFKKLKPLDTFLNKFDSKQETKRKADRDRYSDMSDADRKMRLKYWRKKTSK